MQESFSPEKGKRYDIVVGMEGERPHYQYRNCVYRGKVRWRDAEMMHFEVELAHVLVEEEDILRMEVVQRRFAL